VPLASVLADFKSKVSQCENLISNSHRKDATGADILPAADREQITIAAFLNMYISWETFLESIFAELLVGASTLNGLSPAKYAAPPDTKIARHMLKSVMKYFDYGNHDYVRSMAKLYFKDGHPFEIHISAVHSDLADMKTMRNSSAHMSLTTQNPLEGLALRIFGKPCIGIGLYQMLTSTHPRSPNKDTVFGAYKTVLITTAELIANG
jgi:hypothetical protein